MIKSVRLGLSLAMAALPLASCAKPAPAGQVLADVDGVDVTRRDLAAELQATGSYDAAPSQVLEQVVQRRLLLRAAHEAGIDRTPEFLAAARRSRDLVLSDMYAQRLARDIPPPSGVELDDYIDGHPYAFANRAIVQVTRIDVPATGAARAALNSATDVKSVIATLAGQGVRPPSVDETLDTADIAPALADGLTKGAAGLVVISSPSGLSGYQVRAVRPAPVTGAAAAAVATRSITTARLTRQIADQIDTERRRAHIRYQAGLGPSSS